MRANLSTFVSRATDRLAGATHVMLTVLLALMPSGLATAGVSKIVFASNRVDASNPDGDFEIYTSDDNGSNQARVNYPDNEVIDTSPVFCGSSRIAFSREDEEGELDLHIMKLDGTDVANLTPTAGDQTEANCTVTASGELWIVYRSNENGNNEIYKIKSDGTGKTRLTNNSDPDENPSWCGSNIVFAHDEGAPGANPDIDWQIYMIDASGGNQRALTCTPNPCPTGQQGCNIDLAFELYWPTCFLNHPTLGGDQLLFDADGHAHYSDTRRIYRVALCSSGCCLQNFANATLLTKATSGGDSRQGSWSPGGEYVTFTSNRTSQNPTDGTTDYEIYKMDSEFGDDPQQDGELSQLTGGTGQQTSDVDPHWREIKP